MLHFDYCLAYSIPLENTFMIVRVDRLEIQRTQRKQRQILHVLIEIHRIGHRVVRVVALLPPPHTDPRHRGPRHHRNRRVDVAVVRDPAVSHVVADERHLLKKEAQDGPAQDLHPQLAPGVEGGGGGRGGVEGEEVGPGEQAAEEAGVVGGVAGAEDGEGDGKGEEEEGYDGFKHKVKEVGFEQALPFEVHAEPPKVCGDGSDRGRVSLDIPAVERLQNTRFEHMRRMKGVKVIGRVLPRQGDNR
mmetsp:Transcript_13244/g.26444  ORF Transcript_13244/g.26444 Transcript_13244/m.26444 type:complete len:245 (-) Transcript_13244:1357-2091(-)